MVRVVGMEGALGAGVGGNCSIYDIRPASDQQSDKRPYHVL